MATIRCPECDKKVKLPVDEDRATVRCGSCGYKIRLDEPDDDDDEPVRPKKKKKKRSKNFFTPYLSMAMRLDNSLKVILGLTVVAVLASCIHPVLYLVPVIYGCALMIIGGAMFLIIAFNDSPMELLLCLFLPFYSLYYLVTHWGETRPAFLMQVYGMVVCFSFVCALPFHALVFGVIQTVKGNRPANERVEIKTPPSKRAPAKMARQHQSPLQRRLDGRLQGQSLTLTSICPSSGKSLTFAAKSARKRRRSSVGTADTVTPSSASSVQNGGYAASSCPGLS
ncbi:MAG: TFIIB-type zinc ribbon-containing protein [Planctomycetes bacterium]|nr:TFIIB-type zinc ribbon-containing protein [Planctomycetota bacterium]